MSRPFSSLRRRIAISVLALAILTAVVGLAVFSAFSSTVNSGTSKFTAGTVSLSSNGTGSVLFNMPEMKPGDSASRCVTVTYAGTLDAKVQMSAKVTDEGLAHYLSTSIVRGTFPGSAPSNNECTGFSPDEPEVNLFTGDLSEAPAGVAADPDTWTTGSVHVYEINVTLPQDTPEGAEGKSAEAEFTWQSQNTAT